MNNPSHSAKSKTCTHSSSNPFAPLCNASHASLNSKRTINPKRITISQHQAQTSYFQQVTMPCLICKAPMHCHNTALISNEHRTRTYFLISCSHCGYGPAQAFQSQAEAIHHWNRFVKENHNYQAN